METEFITQFASAHIFHRKDVPGRSGVLKEYFTNLHCRKAEFARSILAEEAVRLALSNRFEGTGFGISYTSSVAESGNGSPGSDLIITAGDELLLGIDVKMRKREKTGRARDSIGWSNELDSPVALLSIGYYGRPQEIVQTIDGWRAEILRSGQLPELDIYGNYILDKLGFTLGNWHRIVRQPSDKTLPDYCLNDLYAHKICQAYSLIAEIQMSLQDYSTPQSPHQSTPKLRQSSFSQIGTRL